jgi:hypothetical protein
MSIRELDGGYAVVKIVLLPEEIPQLVALLDYDPPRVPLLEDMAAALIRDGFPGLQAQIFVRRVIEWGRGHRFVERTIVNNSPTQIATALSTGFDAAMAGDPAEGVERISELRHLGQSFASKQLRFLVPTKAVIFDSEIRERLGYSETRVGYSAFLEDCKTILHKTKTSDRLPTAVSDALRVCDIEAALYSKLQGY